MITSLVIAFLLATTILWINPQNTSFRWLSAALYFMTLMILIFLIDFNYANANHLFINSLFFIADIGLAFTLGMFGVNYSGIFYKKNQSKLILIHIGLLFVVWLLTPLSPERRINYEGLNELPLVIYISLTLLFGAILLIVAHYKEIQPFKKIERLLTNLLILPMLFFFIFSYIFYLFDIDLFQFNYIYAIFFLILFLVVGINKGALGVKIKIQMIKADASINVLRGGASLVGHTFKNEIGKIDILLHQIKKEIDLSANTSGTSKLEINEMFSMADDSVHHIQSLLVRMNEKIKDIQLDLKKANLIHVLEPSLNHVEKIVRKEIKIIRNLRPVPDVWHDPIHIKEVIQNLLMNAVESIGESGFINVSLYETYKEVVIEIEDTGAGISKDNISTIFNPFFSTKNMKSNYGLGLFYCKNVMDKHKGGSIHVSSTEGKGSTFQIRFQKAY